MFFGTFLTRSAKKILQVFTGKVRFLVPFRAKREKILGVSEGSQIRTPEKPPLLRAAQIFFSNPRKASLVKSGFWRQGGGGSVSVSTDSNAVPLYLDPAPIPLRMTPPVTLSVPWVHWAGPRSTSPPATAAPPSAASCWSTAPTRTPRTLCALCPHLRQTPPS